MASESRHERGRLKPSPFFPSSPPTQAAPTTPRLPASRPARLAIRALAGRRPAVNAVSMPTAPAPTNLLGRRGPAPGPPSSHVPAPIEAADLEDILAERDACGVS